MRCFQYHFIRQLSYVNKYKYGDPDRLFETGFEFSFSERKLMNIFCENSLLIKSSHLLHLEASTVV
jgi:hypothetical protein